MAAINSISVSVSAPASHTFLVAGVIPSRVVYPPLAFVGGRLVVLPPVGAVLVATPERAGEK